jgi:hypothetical protein
MKIKVILEFAFETLDELTPAELEEFSDHLTTDMQTCYEDGVLEIIETFNDDIDEKIANQQIPVVSLVSSRNES